MNTSLLYQLRNSSQRILGHDSEPRGPTALRTLFLVLATATIVGPGVAFATIHHNRDFGQRDDVIGGAGLEVGNTAAASEFANPNGGPRRSRDISPDACVAAASGTEDTDENGVANQLLRIASPVRYGVALPLPSGTVRSDLGSFDSFYMLSMPQTAVTMASTVNRYQYDALVCLGLFDTTGYSDKSIRIKLRTLDISSAEGQTWRTTGFVNFTDLNPICMAQASGNFLPALTVSTSLRDVFVFGFGVYDECAELFVWSNVAGLRHVATSGGDQVAHLYHSLTSQAIDGDGGVRLVAFGGKLCPHVDKSGIDECLASNGTNSLWHLDMRNDSAVLPSWQPVGIAAGSVEPSPRFSADIFAVNSSALVMYGGFRQLGEYTTEPLCDLWLFDGATPGTWRQLGNLSEDCQLRSRCVRAFPVAIKQLATFVASSSTVLVVAALCHSRDYTVYSFDINGNPSGRWQAAKRSTLFGDPTFFFFGQTQGKLTKLALASSANGSVYVVEDSGNSTHRLVFDRTHVDGPQPLPGTAAGLSAALLSTNDGFVGNWGCVAAAPVTLPLPVASQAYIGAFQARLDVHSFLLGGMCGNGFGNLQAEEVTVMPVWTMATIGQGVQQPYTKVYYTKSVPTPGPLFGRRIGHSTVHQADAGTEIIVVFGGGLALSIDAYAFKLAPADLWCFDIHDYVWVSSKTGGSGPGPRMFHVAFAVANTSFAVYGGTDQRNEVFHATNDLWLFTFTDVASCSGNWADLTAVAEPPLPALYGHTTIMFRGHQLIYSGGDSTAHCCVSDLLFSIDIGGNGSVSWHSLSFGPAGPPLGRRFHTMTRYTDNSLLIMGNHSKPCDRREYYSTTMLFVFNMSDILSPAAVTAVPFFNSHVTFFMQKVGGYLLGGRTTFQNSKQGDAGQQTFVYGNQYATLQFGRCPLGQESNASASTLMTDCVPCAKDAYSSSLSRPCTPCPNGTLTKAGGATDVSACFAPDQCLPDPCHGHGSCNVESGRAVCYCDPGYMPQTQCYLPVYFIIAGVVGLVVIATVTAVTRKYRRSRRQAFERGRQLRASHRKISELTRVWEIEWQQLSMREKVAAGGFGEVWLAEFSDMLVAVKKLIKSNLSDPNSIQDFQREVELMQTLRHPNVVLFLGAGTIPTGELFIVMEYLKRGALRDLLRDPSVPLDLADQLRFGLDAARGMAFLHGLSPPRIHRDLKSSNLLVSDKWVVKVADFGTARLVETLDQLQPAADRELQVQYLNGGRNGRLRDERRPLLHEGGMLSTQVGTSLWQSPEMMMRQEYGASTDVFSFGIVLYEIFFRKAPYVERKDFRFYSILTDAVVAGYRPDLSRYPGDNDVPKDFTDLMELCWQGAPAERPTFEEIVARLSKLNLA